MEDHFWQLVSHYKVDNSRALYTGDISDRTAAADILCPLCWESDHKMADCALALLSHKTQPPPSVNDTIEPSPCSIQYASVFGRHCLKGARLWAGVLMAKLDLKTAHHMVPVHSADSPTGRNQP